MSLAAYGLRTLGLSTRGLGAPAVTPSVDLPTTIRRAVVAALKRDAAVAAVVGAKVYSLKQIESQPCPALVYDLRSDATGHTLNGPDGTSTARFDFTCLTRTLEDGEDLADAVRDVFDGLLQQYIPGSAVWCLDAYKLDEGDDYAPPIDASANGRYMTPVSIVIKYRKPKPPGR